MSAKAALQNSSTGQLKDPRKGSSLLHYDRSATHWNEALPIGNGRIGGMVWGKVSDEVIDLNEETLWSGHPRETDNPNAKQYLPRIRKAVFEKDYELANDLAYKIQGTYNESYQPLGQLLLTLEHTGEALNYARTLDIGQALSSVTYEVGGVEFHRQYFVSAPDNVMCIRLTANKPGKISCRVRLSSRLKHESFAKGNSCILQGQAPSHVEREGIEADQVIFYDPEEEGLSFYAQLRVIPEGGRMRKHENGVRVEKANAVMLVFSAATNFDRFDVFPRLSRINPRQIVEETLHKISQMDYDELQRRHCDDYKKLFDRVSLRLGNGNASKTTDQRIKLYAENEDPDLVALTFQYGRYMLISSSRPGTLPANLQGIWNPFMRPSWMSNWTNDLNTQMNYWLSWTTNLPECEQALINWIDHLRPNGRKTARTNYGAKGWLCHNSTDLWMQTAPAGIERPRWCILPLGGTWLCQHLWMHYVFHGDREFLKHRAYPIMREAAEFCLNWLIKDEDGMYVTCPSVSPENWFETVDNKQLSISKACTYDMQLIRDLFSNCITAASELGIDEQFSVVLQERLDHLYVPKIGKYGQLQEWSEDWDKPDDQHRHVSHLFGLFPGDQLTPNKDPEGWAAARVSLQMRTGEMAKGQAGKNDADTGWSVNWKLAWWARLHDAAQAREMLLNVFRFAPAENVSPGQKGGRYLNLLNAGPPFQIDGVLGFTAGVAELLVQSHDGFIHLLSALPENWPEGQVSGLKTRGGFIVDMKWAGGKLLEAVIHPGYEKDVCVRYGNQDHELKDITEPAKIEF
ncbi:glycoside hydrolase family 95 protein [Pontiella desulfatans]|nr:glycoside hydrolase family 95 protein [Pontiella desulfatans]